MNTLSDRDAYSRLYRAALKRMKTDSPTDLFHTYVYGPECLNYPADLVNVLDNLDGAIAMRISNGQDAGQAERELALVGIMFLAMYDLLHIPESCDELSGPEDDLVRHLLDDE